MKRKSKDLHMSGAHKSAVIKSGMLQSQMSGWAGAWTHMLLQCLVLSSLLVELYVVNPPRT